MYKTVISNGIPICDRNDFVIGGTAVVCDDLYLFDVDATDLWLSSLWNPITEDVARADYEMNDVRRLSYDEAKRAS